ncbi:hypothetical protein [Algicola sagamiensis]|uniref:hypothetical protein n=1 Tax=Algicola sagamiensis TaxID=163869 RepID=UPI0003799B3B|nr:hypothetical protein [Algicola sagamiensis]
MNTLQEYSAKFSAAAFLLKLALLGLFMSALPSSANPVSPQVRNVMGLFSVDRQRQFHLFADSNQDNLIWYIPKMGGIRPVQGRPQFGVDHYTLTDGPMNGMNSLSFSGEFSTAGIAGHISALNQEAQQKGFIIRPAKATSADSQFLLSGFKVGNDGLLSANCELESWTGPRGNMDIPICRAVDSDGQWRELDFFMNFHAMTPSGGAVNQIIPFTAKTMPGWDDVVQNLLDTASNWDAQIQVITDWTLQTNTTLKDARVTIYWPDVLSYLISRVRNTRWQVRSSLIDSLLNDAINGRKGLAILYFQSNGELSQLPQSTRQKNRVQFELIQNLRKALFVPIKPRPMPIRDMVQRADPINPVVPYVPLDPDTLRRKWGRDAGRIDRLLPNDDRMRHVERPTPELPMDITLPINGLLTISKALIERDIPCMRPYDGVGTMAVDCVPPFNPCDDRLMAMDEAARRCDCLMRTDDNALEVRAPIFCDPEPPRPIPSDLYFLLKANYWRMLNSPLEIMHITLRGVEQVNASTYMSIDCVRGSIGGQLSFDLSSPACREYVN